MGCDNVVLGE